ncbi:nuclear factor NF-kappa-B p100 subunit-like isoform X2 [Pectinophora gossypiella]|uniref:nuclear factor NF-kappa-B p100 subunit-like isoform X2 n=1 Tax=Pectinophora gossypiella TaxID=13191 RepID=UPI00214EC63C|nr:nuclear factor NF-kappa-B p100 subunit-like isoform X2 [Pectinophora gossypiella]
MSASEQDFSESSNMGSPGSQGDSPYSSPSQQVPHLVNVFSGITCADEMSLHADGKRPYLRVVEQPQNYFRFRYKSEMVGTHGCLLGKSTSSNKTRTHPTVELMNYTGRALIRVRLTQADKDEEHPHKLLEDEQEDRDVSTLVPEQGSYKVGFAGMGIIHTAKKDVPALLLKKYMERSPNIPVMDLRMHCENTAKTINLNIVRLRFSAHDLKTDQEICAPVFSDPIHNMKSAATNDLKICRISKYFGRPRGGEDVFILVEKVNKKNIIIRFYELNEQGEEVWTANGNFLQSDVHHQYAVVFRTPPYRDLNITKNVKVFIELVRPSDGRTSEPKEFVYKADQVIKANKRRRVNSTFSSYDSSSGGSIKSIGDVPTTVEMLNQTERSDPNANIPAYQINFQIPQLPVVQPTPSNDLADALLYGAGAQFTPTVTPINPMLSQTHVPEPPIISLNSAELDRLIHDPQLPQEERKKFCEMDWSEYMQSFGESLPDKTLNSMEFLRTSMQLVADSGKGMSVKKEVVSPSRSSTEERKTNILDKAKSSHMGYTAVYTNENGTEVKQLVKEICEIMKNKNAYKKQVVRDKLTRLFSMRLSNGDTFLHMALSSNQSSLEYMIKLVHSMKMVHLLNLTNELQQTILHLAVINDLPKLVPFLIAHGCDPMMADAEGNNVIHYAVVCQSCLKPLLEAIKSNDVAYDLDAYNNEMQTALHVAATYDSEASVRLLLRHGAGRAARDAEGRTPLHLAAYDDCLAALRPLLHHTPAADIDLVDGAGNTALQIVCGKQNMGKNKDSTDIYQQKQTIVKLLLEKKANPVKHEGSSMSAWQLARDKPELRELMSQYAPPGLLEDDVKSEPEDDFESADEGESQETCLQELPLYIAEVSALLDARGAWRQLATKLQLDALLSWYGNTQSPTRTLLSHVKEAGDNLTSKSLAMYLQDMGQNDVADIIRRYID